MRFDDVFGSIGSMLASDGSNTTAAGLRLALDGFASLLNDPLPDVGGFHPQIPFRDTDDGPLTLDVVEPTGEGPFPVLVYFHGGAWVAGSPETHQLLAHRLAQEGFLVMSVDYRLAPEHPFPAGFNDCIHAIYFAANEAHRWRGDSDQLVLAGDSAGANLAAACAINLANTPGAPAIHAVGLLYGVYDWAQFEGGTITGLLIDAYLQGDEQLISDPRVSPIVKAQQLPPAHIACGTSDPLMEDAEALRVRLARSGNIHEFHQYEDMPHAFSQIEWFDDARPSIQRMAAFMHSILDETSP